MLNKITESDNYDLNIKRRFKYKKGHDFCQP